VPNSSQTFVIVGAGPAGGQAALTLRRFGFEGRIVMVGEESRLPYERPPLSKEAITDEQFENVPYLPGIDSDFDNKIEAITSTRARRIQRQSQIVELDDGRSVAYDKLLITTGARVRPLSIPGSEKRNVRYLRTYDDSMALKTLLRPGMRLVVIGGGFIGLEVASSARKLECDVTVLEAAPRLMGRAVPEVVSEFFAGVHRRNGVDVRVGVSAVRLAGEGDRVECVDLGDNNLVSADVVLVGIGVIPNTELAEEAGLEVDDGIVVDEFARTSDPNIFAAGDVARHFNLLVKRHLRTEAWEVAINHASAAAENMCGNDVPFSEIPWVWTNQCDVNMQMAGCPVDYDTDIVRGDPSQGDFTLFQLKANRVVGVITVNRGVEMNYGKRLIANAKEYEAAELSDESIKLRSLVKR
jgi:NADPH-dependent 2,4-dienoyl-CoA reductase/sulfur reductase-like enzyme